jgi:hypothetical protein
MDYQRVNYLYSGKNKTVLWSQIMKIYQHKNKSQAVTDLQHNRATKPYTVGLTKQNIL